MKFGEMGLSVLPLHGVVDGVCSCGKANCNKPGKHPRTRSWKDASTESARIGKLWARWPEANVGIVTEPSGLVVVDVDPKNGGDKTFAEIKNRFEVFDSVPCVRTGGGGWHYYFRAPKDADICSGTNVFGRGIDIRAKGGLIVAPPSSHLSGNCYEWVRDLTHALIPYPKGLQDLALVKKSQPGKMGKAGRERFDYSSGALIPHGRRNEVLHMAARSFRFNGLDSATTFQMLRFLRDSRCENPELVTDEELKNLASSAWTYPININLCLYIRWWREFELGQAEFSFLVNLATDQQNLIPNPSVAWIVKSWGLSESTLKRVRASLVEKKLLLYKPGQFKPVPIAATYVLVEPPSVTGSIVTRITKDIIREEKKETVLCTVSGAAAKTASALSVLPKVRRERHKRNDREKRGSTHVRSP